jgi:hypothetical protein
LQHPQQVIDSMQTNKLVEEKKKKEFEDGEEYFS